MKNFKIAIDGPAGSGKSSVAKEVSKKLNVAYIDTGAMYRSVAYYALKNNVSTENEEEIEKILDDINIEFKTSDNKHFIYVNNEDVTDLIRSQEVGNNSSKVAAMLCVRTKLVDMQKNIAKNISVVMDGRDICTNVLPDADVKIFMTASALERAKRRVADLKKLNIDADFATIENEIIARDLADSNRELNPLKKADDAILIDTTSSTLIDTTNIILDIVYKNCM